MTDTEKIAAIKATLTKRYDEYDNIVPVGKPVLDAVYLADTLDAVEDILRAE